MKHNYWIPSILLSFLILYSSCKKESNTNDSDTSSGYTSVEYISNQLPLLGGCLDTNGDLLFFQKPLLDSTTQNHVVITAKIIRSNGLNSISTEVDFQNMTFGMGNYLGTHFNGQFGWIPEGTSVSLAVLDNGKLFMANNISNSLLQIINGSYYNYISLDGIVAVTSYNNILYVATSPIYNGAGDVIHPPRIYEIDSLGQQSLYYEFSSSIDFNNYSGGEHGGGNGMYPFGFSISLKMDADSSLYVAFGYNDIIYKIDKDKNLSTVISNIPYPVAIDIDSKKMIYVVSARAFTMDSLFHLTMTKPVQLYTIHNGLQTKIYEGNFDAPLYNCGNTLHDSLHREIQAFYSLAVSPSGNKIFLVSPIEGNVILIH